MPGVQCPARVPVVTAHIQPGAEVVGVITDREWKHALRCARPLASTWGFPIPSEWQVVGTELPRDVVGLTSWPEQVIAISPDYPPAYQRMALMHELVHVERGPVLNEPALAAREEAVVERETARRLIDVEDLAECLREVSHLDGRRRRLHAAEVLHVDPETMNHRFTALTRRERTYLRARLAGRPAQPPRPSKP